MKINAMFLALMMAFVMISCGDNNDPADGDELPIYSISIMSPSTQELPVGESFHIHVNFDEEKDLTIHHINVQITNAAGEVLYSEPSVAHVHDDSGHFEHHDDFVLDVDAGEELTLTAKVWGHMEGLAEISEITTFTAQ